MPDYKFLYFQLFADMAGAVQAIEQMDFGTARSILIHAQQQAEDAYLAQTEKEETD